MPCRSIRLHPKKSWIIKFLFPIMKTSNLFLLSLLLTSSLGTRAQVAGTGSSSAATVPQPTPWSITARDGNSATWQRTTYELSWPSGQTVAKQQTYKELATGLNFWNGQWTPSSENIAILPNGTGAATNGQHQAYWPGDIYNGVIQLVTPDGLTLTSQPVALGYDDGSNTVLFAALTNSAGELLPSGNQVLYPNAFPGLGDILYVNTLAGILAAL
jgi:hypothetical protein